MLQLAAIIVHLLFSYLVADKIGRKKTIGFGYSLLLCLLITPFFGYLITENFGVVNPRGCKWCGNKENEAEYCGECGKNDAGEIRKGFEERKWKL